MTIDGQLFDQLKAQVKVVAKAREKVSVLKQQRNELLEEWNKANQELFDTLTQSGADVAVAEQELRDMTLLAFFQTGDKAPVKGVGIREMTKLEYDVGVAYSWALEHKMAMKLDVSAFEKVAKASPLDFVKVYQEPIATIATDLSGIVAKTEDVIPVVLPNGKQGWMK